VSLDEEELTLLREAEDMYGNYDIDRDRHADPMVPHLRRRREAAMRRREGEREQQRTRASSGPARYFETSSWSESEDDDKQQGTNASTKSTDSRRRRGDSASPKGNRGNHHHLGSMAGSAGTPITSTDLASGSAGFPSVDGGEGVPLTPAQERRAERAAARQRRRQAADEALRVDLDRALASEDATRAFAVAGVLLTLGETGIATLAATLHDFMPQLSHEQITEMLKDGHSSATEQRDARRSQRQQARAARQQYNSAALDVYLDHRGGAGGAANRGGGGRMGAASSGALVPVGSERRGHPQGLSAVRSQAAGHGTTSLVGNVTARRTAQAAAASQAAAAAADAFDRWRRLQRHEDATQHDVAAGDSVAADKDEHLPQRAMANYTTATSRPAPSASDLHLASLRRSADVAGADVSAQRRDQRPDATWHQHQQPLHITRDMQEGSAAAAYFNGLPIVSGTLLTQASVRVRVGASAFSIGIRDSTGSAAGGLRVMRPLYLPYTVQAGDDIVVDFESRPLGVAATAAGRNLGEPVPQSVHPYRMPSGW
jgi:hypothetical protein